MSTAFKSAITTNQTITDNREGATTGNGTIRLATLDRQRDYHSRQRRQIRQL